MNIDIRENKKYSPFPLFPWSNWFSSFIFLLKERKINEDSLEIKIEIKTKKKKVYYFVIDHYEHFLENLKIRNFDNVDNSDNPDIYSEAPDKNIIRFNFDSAGVKTYEIEFLNPPEEIIFFIVRTNEDPSDEQGNWRKGISNVKGYKPSKKSFQLNTSKKVIPQVMKQQVTPSLNSERQDATFFYFEDLENWEDCFEEIIKIIYHVSEKQSSTKFNRQEAIWLINSHRLTLEAFRDGLSNTDDLLHQIFQYTGALWNEYKEESSKKPKEAMKDLSKKYIDFSNSLLEKCNPKPDSFILPIVVSQKMGQFDLFLNTLSKICEEMDLLRAELEKFAESKAFIHKLQEELEQCKKNFSKNCPSFCPKEAFSRTFKIFEQLYQVWTLVFILPEGPKLWNKLEGLWTLFEESYPEVSHLKREYTFKRKIPYLKIYNSSQPLQKLYSWSEERHRVIEWQAEPVSLTQKETVILRELVELSLEKEAPELFNLVSKISDVSKKAFTPQKKLHLKEILKTINLTKEEKKQILKKMLEYVRSSFDYIPSSYATVIEQILPLLQIELIYENNFQNYDLDEYITLDWGKSFHKRLSRPGGKVEGKIIQEQEPEVLFEVKEPYCLKNLQALVSFIEQNILEKSKIPFARHGKKQLQKKKEWEELLSLCFWSHWQSKEDFEKELFSKLEDLYIKEFDQLVYETPTAYRKEIRCHYEKLLHKLENTLFSDNLEMTIISGNRESREHKKRIEWKLAERELEDYVEPGYPLSTENFTRCIYYLDKKPENETMEYCRDFEPHLLTHLSKKKIPIDCPQLENTIDLLKNKLRLDWPQCEGLLDIVLKELVNPLNKKLLEKNIAQELRFKGFHSYLADLFEAVEKDNLGKFYPHPKIFGKTFEASDKNCFAKKQFSSEKDKRIVLEIQNFVSSPNQSYSVLVGAGKEPKALKWYHNLLKDIRQWDEVFSTHFILNKENLPEDQEFEQYLNKITSEEDIKEFYYPILLNANFTLESLHKKILNHFHIFERLDPELHSLLDLLDTYSTVLYPEGKQIELLAEKIVNQFNEQPSAKSKIEPVSIGDSLSGKEDFLYYMCSDNKPLRIRQRKIPTQDRSIIYLHGNNRGKDFNYQSENQEFVKKIRILFIEIWYLLQQITSVRNRSRVTKEWEFAHYESQMKGTWDSILNLFYIFYRNAEILESEVPKFEWSEWEPKFNFLETWLEKEQDILKIFVRRGMNIDSSPDIKKHYRLTHQKTKNNHRANNSVIRVTRPAFIRKSTDARIGRRGELDWN